MLTGKKWECCATLRLPVWGSLNDEYRKAETKRVPAPASGKTASGYGSRIPTDYMLRFDDASRWLRVYCRVYSNMGTLYVRVREYGKIQEYIVTDIQEVA